VLVVGVLVDSFFAVVLLEEELRKLMGIYRMMSFLTLLRGERKLETTIGLR
jgi:hypothetical protein